MQCFGVDVRCTTLAMPGSTNWMRRSCWRALQQDSSTPSTSSSHRSISRRCHSKIHGKARLEWQDQLAQIIAED
eukprot:1858723-Amphidinium_carterae.1